MMKMKSSIAAPSWCGPDSIQFVSDHCAKGIAGCWFPSGNGRKWSYVSQPSSCQRTAASIMKSSRRPIPRLNIARSCTIGIRFDMVIPPS